MMSQGGLQYETVLHWPESMRKAAFDQLKTWNEAE
jgi:hypothetical protein